MALSGARIKNWYFTHVFIVKLDGVGPVDNRPSTYAPKEVRN